MMLATLWILALQVCAYYIFDCANNVCLLGVSKETDPSLVEFLKCDTASGAEVHGKGDRAAARADDLPSQIIVFASLEAIYLRCISELQLSLGKLPSMDHPLATSGQSTELFSVSPHCDVCACYGWHL
jgi:hypothetical protein